ncbi:MAG: hypothetical protein OES25_16845 [Acidobacteriota bacterium]|nr:hypothetical protein [Acidobacteriota bacterium]
MRRAAKIDDKIQTAIVKALRDLGCSVVSTAAVGNGFPDLIVARGAWKGLDHHPARTVLLEVKNPDMPPSKKRLNDKQIAFLASWKGECYRVESVFEAVSIMFGPEKAARVCDEISREQ